MIHYTIEKTHPVNLINMRYLTILMIFLLFVSCDNSEKDKPEFEHNASDISLAILGIAQDAGYPQAGCLKDCCKPFREGKEKARSATSIAIIDRTTDQTWLFEATPDFNIQLSKMDQFSSSDIYPYDGIFMTHGHIGHYTGLMHLGREAMGTSNVPVWRG